MLHPATRLEWIRDDVGYGVIATAPIPKGTLLWALDPLDRRLGPPEVDRLGEALWPHLERYTYVNGRGERVLCWDHGRFMNHSCAPVSLSPGVDFELAVRDLAPGDEVTCDYASLNLEEALACLCGEPGCRGVITSDDFEDLAPVWDEQLRDAVRFALDVPQPLLGWVDREALARWARRPDALPSALSHRFPPRDYIGFDAGAPDDVGARAATP